MRQSLRGDAHGVCLRLGSNATIPEILAKFDILYGSLEVEQEVMAAFFSARQEENESVVGWATRLESILYKIQENNQNEHFDGHQACEMLRTMLWLGLKPGLKAVAGHKYDKTTGFDDLCKEMRKVEAENLKQEQRYDTNSANKKSTHSHVAIDVTQKQIEGIQKDLKELRQLWEGVESKMKPATSSRSDNSIGNAIKFSSGTPLQSPGEHHSYYSYPPATSTSNSQNTYQLPASGYVPMQPTMPKFYSPSPPPPPPPPLQPHQFHSNDWGQQSTETPLCWKCNQPGHFKRQCPSNFGIRPTTGGWV